jgi:predicted ester cyclase
MIINMVNSLSGARKDRASLARFIADESLIHHFLFFDSLFPASTLLIDELTAEGSRIVLRMRMRGRHEGTGLALSPTFQDVEFPMVFGFEVEQQKIVHHWLIADQVKLLDQLRSKT